MTFHEIAAYLEETLGAALPLLLAMTEGDAPQREAPGKWSKKQILGHLIDSATNNHQRFIRLQFDTELVFPGYAQADWVEAGRYTERPWLELVELWSAYNRHLAHVIRQANEDAAGNVWKYPSGDMTLEFLMRDYVDHMHHHLRQICPGESVQIPWRKWIAKPWTL